MTVSSTKSLAVITTYTQLMYIHTYVHTCKPNHYTVKRKHTIVWCHLAPCLAQLYRSHPQRLTTQPYTSSHSHHTPSQAQSTPYHPHATYSFTQPISQSHHTLPLTSHHPHPSPYHSHTLPPTPYYPNLTTYTLPPTPTLTLLGKVSTTIEVPSVNANGQCIAPSHQLDLIVGAEGILQSSGSTHDNWYANACAKTFSTCTYTTYVCTIYNSHFLHLPSVSSPLSHPQPPPLPTYTLTSTFNPESAPG